MKTIVKRIARDEKGAALVLALILLLVGGLISAALLGHMGAGLLAGEVYGRRATELYAADAGVEDAIWKLQNGEVPVCSGDPSRSYNITDVNGKKVEYTIEYVGDGTYKITSVAITDSDGSGGIAAIDSATTVEAYLSASYLDLSPFLDNAIISQGIIDIQPHNLVNGDVWLPINDEEHLQIHDPADITGDVKDSKNMTLTWPTADQLSSYYLDDVDPSNPYPYNSIDITYTKNIGPCYIEGDFVVDNTGDPDTLILDGTVYISDDVQFSQAGSHDYTINLNGNTIFAGGSIDFPSNAVTISGSGCIIAVGNVNFQPAIASAEDDFVLVMSITGRTDFHPSGDFTGCIAGNTEVQLQPGCTINWIDPEDKGLNFPGMGDGDESPPVTGVSIESWEVKQQ